MPKPILVGYLPTDRMNANQHMSDAEESFGHLCNLRSHLHRDLADNALVKAVQIELIQKQLNYARHFLLQRSEKTDVATETVIG